MEYAIQKTMDEGFAGGGQAGQNYVALLCTVRTGKKMEYAIQKTLDEGFAWDGWAGWAELLQ